MSDVVLTRRLIREAQERYGIPQGEADRIIQTTRRNRFRKRKSPSCRVQKTPERVAKVVLDLLSASGKSLQEIGKGCHFGSSGRSTEIIEALIAGVDPSTRNAAPDRWPRYLLQAGVSRSQFLRQVISQRRDGVRRAA